MNKYDKSDYAEIGIEDSLSHIQFSKTATKEQIQRLKHVENIMNAMYHKNRAYSKEDDMGLMFDKLYEMEIKKLEMLSSMY